MPTVEIWQAGLSHPPELVGDLRAMLTDGERERAARLASAPRWIAARAALRIVLAGHLGAHPGDVELGAGPHGKPEVPGSALRFNLSHSGDLALIALTTEAEVGVDVERTSRRSRAVERTLTDGERATLDGRDDHTELLRIWCRKEAMAKAGGGGLGAGDVRHQRAGRDPPVRSRARRRLRRSPGHRRLPRRRRVVPRRVLALSSSLRKLRGVVCDI